MACDMRVMLVVRPIFAVVLVIALIVLGWVGAWKLVLVHVPLVQELTKTKRKSRRTTPQAQALPRFSRRLYRSHTPDPVDFPKEAEG